MKDMYKNFDRSLPILSVVAVFTFFLFEGFFQSSTGKLLFTIFCILGAIGDSIFRVSFHGFTRKDSARYISAGLGLFAVLSFILRGWLDFPPQPGIPQESTILPKLREFLLALTVVLSISFLAYTILLEIGRRSLEAQSQLSDKKKGLLQNTVMGFLLLIPVLVAVNYVAIMRNYNFDLSSSGKYSLSPISKSLLKNLNGDVEIIGFYPRPLESDGPGSSLSLSRVRPNLEIIFAQYKASNPKIQTRFINADVEADLLSGMGQVSNGVILIRSPRELLPGETNPYNEERINVREKSDLEDLERKMTSAILNITTPKRRVYFTTANGERYGTGFRNLKNEQVGKLSTAIHYLNFELRELGFAEGWPKEVPKDADLLMILGPTVEFSDEAQSAVLDYLLKEKGKIFVSVEPKGEEDFSWLLDKAGVKFLPDGISQKGSKPNLIVAKEFPDHPISSFIPKPEQGIVFPYSGYFETFVDGKKGFDFLSKFILETGVDAFLDRDGTGKPNLSTKQENDSPSTQKFKLGLVLQTLNSDSAVSDKVDEEGRAVVFSGTSWITDQFISYNMNRNLALSSITWLYQDNIINEIPKKKDQVDTINLTDRQKIWVWLIGMFVFPGVIIIGGSYYVVSRRKRGVERYEE